MDAIPLPHLAKHYHCRNVALSEQIQHPPARGHAYLGLGFHEHYRGRPQAALENFQRSGDFYKEAGHLRGVAVAKTRAGSILGRIGDFASAIKAAREAIQIGQDSG